MLTQETKDFCWAAECALTDLIMLEIYQVKDKMGLCQVIDEMTNQEIFDLTTHLITLDENSVARHLDSIYYDYLQEKSEDLCIPNERTLLYERNFILSEANESKDLSAEEIIQIGRNVSISAAVTAYAAIFANDPPKAIKKYKRINRELGRDFTKAIRSNPKLWNAVDPKSYVKRQSIERTRAAIKKGLKNKTLTQAEADKMRKGAAAKADKVASWATSKSKTAALNDKVRDLVAKSKETPQQANARKKAAKNAKEALKKANNGKIPLGKGSKAVLIGSGIVAVSVLAYTIYKNLNDKARKSCAGQKGKAKTICMTRYRITACDKSIKALQESLPGCQEKSDPTKCKYSVQKQIWNWTRRKQKYQQKLAKLTQIKNKNGK